VAEVTTSLKSSRLRATCVHVCAYVFALVCMSVRVRASVSVLVCMCAFVYALVVCMCACVCVCVLTYKRHFRAASAKNFRCLAETSNKILTTYTILNTCTRARAYNNTHNHTYVLTRIYVVHALTSFSSPNRTSVWMVRSWASSKMITL